jgi:hypothetical protein
MQYLLVFQFLCGCFSAFVAGRKGRSRLGWWLIGALVPFFGLLLSLMVGAARPEAAQGQRTDRPERAAHRPTGRPKRCTGIYMPDCLGCPHFRRRLFDSEPRDGAKGTCTYFGRVLDQEPTRADSQVAIDES